MEKKRQEDKQKRLEQMRIDFIADMQRKESKLWALANFCQLCVLMYCYCLWNWVEEEAEEKERLELEKIAEAQKILEMNLRQQAEYFRVKEEEEEAERLRQLEYKNNYSELEEAINLAKRLAEEEARKRLVYFQLTNNGTILYILLS